jgi:hypothetical protein
MSRLLLDCEERIRPRGRVDTRSNFGGEGHRGEDDDAILSTLYSPLHLSISNYGLDSLMALTLTLVIGGLL